MQQLELDWINEHEVKGIQQGAFAKSKTELYVNIDRLPLCSLPKSKHVLAPNELILQNTIGRP